MSRPPLVPFETFVADPPQLPVRGPGDDGLSAVARAELLTAEPPGATCKATTSTGETLAVAISAAGDGVIRVRLAEDPNTVSRSAAALALVSPRDCAAATVDTDGRTVRVSAGALTAEVQLDPWHVRFLDASGRVLLEQDRGQDDISGRQRTLPFGRSLVDGEVAAYHESFLAPADERFVGLGEKFTRLDKRGQRALMWNYDAFGAESDRSHKAVPFYLSSRGYGVLVDSGLPTEFDVCQSTHSAVQIIVPDDLVDYYVIAGPTPAQVLDRYDQLTSCPLLPPKWAFGAWISSGFFADSQESVLDRATRLREQNIPCDVMHLDCFWQVVGHWSDLRWDSASFPDPAAMLDTLAGQGFRVCLWINPYISHLSPAFEAAADAGYFLTRADGSPYVADTWHGSYPACGIVDFTNPAAVEWFTGLLRPLLEQGAAVFKTDFAEGVPADAVASNGLTGIELHNVYTLLFNDAVADVTREVAGHGMVWARSSFLGGQRHSAQWGGDVAATYPAMGSTIRGGLSHGLSGVPFWSHDVGGFHGTPAPDLYVRWAQFGALSPLVRFHGTSSRLPWDFPADAAGAAVDALRLRYRLMPYLYSTAVDSARTGAPMMRALLVDSPADPAAWTEELAYRLGSDLLVAPMIDPTGSRAVYLPRGEEWADWHTGQVYPGGQYVTVTKPLSEAPLFVRVGALIPVLTEDVDQVGDDPFGEITLLSFGATSGDVVVHDVNGSTTVTVDERDGTPRLRVEGPAPVMSLRTMPITR